MVDAALRLTLSEMSAPPGQIELSDLAPICARLQELTTRVGRWVAEIDRPGRSPAAIERATKLWLSGVGQGSTVLEISRGPQGMLDFDMPFEKAVDERLWDTIEAIARDSPPDDTPQAVRDSALGLLDALAKAARRVEISRPGGRPVSFRPTERNREVWASTAAAGNETVTVSGVVEMVDLRSHRFRLRDDVGNAIALNDVADVTAARGLVGERADAVGQPVRDNRGRLMALSSSTVVPAQIPSAWTERVRDDAWREAAHAMAPDPDGGADFDDAEWAAFLAAVKGQ